MQVKNFLYPLLAICFVAACDKSEQWGSAQQTQSVEVSISASHSAMSRTALGDVPSDVTSGSEQPIEWSVGDKISVWAKADGDENYTLDGVTFTLSTYNSTFDDADFMATIDPMLEGTYAYHAVYPEPTAKSGTKVSYTLPSNQSGAYDPALDVMAAQATGNALVGRVDDEPTNLTWQEPQLEFNHLFHMIRIRIPEGKNLLGQPIKRLDIVFPRDVVGTAEFDVTNPSNITWSNMSNKITVEIPDESNYLDENSNYVWLYIIPGALNGEITFQAYDSYGVMSNTISTTLNKMADANRITPIALTVPKSNYDITYLDFKVHKNNLGEQLTKISLSGLTFIDADTYSQTSTISLLSDNANPQIFKVAVVGAPSSVQNSDVTITYISQHAKIEERSIPLTTESTIFEDTSINVLSSDLVAENSNIVKMVVPYLYYEDFSNAKTYANNDDGSNSLFSTSFNGVDLTENANLANWSGARCGVNEGVSARINVRTEATGMSWLGSARYCGRIDSPFIENINENKEPNVIVKFNYAITAGVKHEIYASWGYHSNTGVINGTQFGGAFSTVDGSSTIQNPMDKDVKGSGGTYSNVSESTSFTIEKCKNRQYRLAWDVYSKGNSVGNSDGWLYIDNIKVSIAN